MFAFLVGLVAGIFLGTVPLVAAYAVKVKDYVKKLRIS